MTAADSPFPPRNHNGGPTLDQDAAPAQPAGRCGDCQNWTPPPESLVQDYEAFQKRISKRRVRRPLGTCPCIKLKPNGMPAFSQTAFYMVCFNFKRKALPAPPPEEHRSVILEYDDGTTWTGLEHLAPEKPWSVKRGCR